MGFQFQPQDKVRLRPESPWAEELKKINHKILDGLMIDAVQNHFMKGQGEKLDGNYCYLFQSDGLRLRACDLEIVAIVQEGDEVRVPDGKIGIVKEVFESYAIVKLETGNTKLSHKEIRLLRRKDMVLPKTEKGRLFESLVLPTDHLSAIEEAIGQTKASVHHQIYTDWGFGELLEKGKGSHLLFYGPPGTGKTLAAEAISQRLNLKIRIIGAAEIESSEPGGAERAIKAYFAQAKKDNLVLCFDECDSLIYHRAHVGMILAAQINCLLSEMERFDGVCIYTTNNTPVLDPAFERRLSLKLEFPMPTKDLRLKIWERMIPRKNILADNVNLSQFAEYQIAGGTIKNIVLNAARRAAYLQKPKIEHEDIEFALKREEKGASAFNQKRDYNRATMKVDYDMGPSTSRDIFKGGMGI